MKDSWKNWPIRGAVLGIAVVAALGFVYLTSVKDREQYLQSRNFRLVAVLARQTEQLIDSRSRVYGENIETLCGRRSSLCGEPDRWTPWPSQDPLIKDGNPATRELAAGRIRYASAGLPLAELLGKRADFQTQVTSDGNMLQFEWSGARSKSPSRSVAVRVAAADMLHGIFDPRLAQGAFDTLVLSDATGRVAYATGRRAAELRTSSLADLLALSPNDSAITRTASERSVSLAGIDYRMFMQPCCRNGTSDEKSGFLVVGLVEKQSMLDASLAVSPVLVLAGVVLVLALLIGWSFLKVALIGSQQRVTRIDVLQLGASAIFGLALATILLLTSSTYARLSADVDAQLAQLANRLDKSLLHEVTRAASQLNKMASSIAREPCITTMERTGRVPEGPCDDVVARWSNRKTLPPDLSRDYPEFSAFTLVDTSGYQRIKAASSDAARRRVDVSDREYFSKARDQDGLWRFEQCPNGCVFEQLWSWTTGKFQVVLSTPSTLKQVPVAALSISMKPLLEAVLPPGFEFAIIDQDGQVQFHSDKQRIVNENLLVETDQDARLRSLVATHGAGTLNTSYWGRPYRAYVRPARFPGWSIVTLHAKQPSRALVLEWSTVALLMQGGYVLLWIALTLTLMTSKASWLWPDPLRRPWYRALSILYVTALVSWIALAGSTTTRTTALVGLLLPPALWGLTCVVLIPRPNDTGQARAWSDLRREYRVAAALLLSVTAAVPGACFFMLSAEEHILAYSKKQHIELSHDVDVVKGCPKQVDSIFPEPDYQRYDDVFYGSNVTCQDAQAQTEGRTRTLFSTIEEYLPYFSSASAPLRQLMYERSNDNAWTSDTTQPGLLSIAVAGREPGYRLWVGAPLLPTFGTRSIGVDPHSAPTAVIPLVMLVGVAFGAYWIVGYLLHRVVLVDVVEPVGTNGHLVTSPGQHVLVVCAQPSALAEELKKKGDVVLPLMLVAAAPNFSSEWRQARRATSKVGPLQRLVIPDIDDGSDELALMRRKLTLIEELMGEPDLTLLVLTQMSKRALASSVRGSWKWAQEPERWSKVVDRLTVINMPSAGGTGASEPEATEPERWLRELRELLKERVDGLRQWWNGSRPDRDWREDLLDAEAAACKTVSPFCTELKDTEAFKTGSLSEDQILEELEERAGSIYRNVWQSCDEDERVVLEHVAQHGLTSTTSRRVVRRLLARGLLRKDPELRLMNRSFRRFVLEAERRREVVILESQAGPSLWDRLRLPLGAGALIGVTFLAATQREAFNATLTVATGLTGLVPVLMKFTNLLSQFTAKGDSKMNG